MLYEGGKYPLPNNAALGPLLGHKIISLHRGVRYKVGSFPLLLFTVLFPLNGGVHYLAAKNRIPQGCTLFGRGRFIFWGVYFVSLILTFVLPLKREYFMWPSKSDHKEGDRVLSLGGNFDCFLEFHLFAKI